MALLLAGILFWMGRTGVVPYVVEVDSRGGVRTVGPAAIDEEMENGGLEAMLCDLLNTRLPEQVNVRNAPVTPWLVDQRLHSYDNKKRWWRGVLQEGGFRDPATDTFISLHEDRPTAVKREDVFASAKQYFAGPKGVDPSPSDVGQFVTKILGELPETRPREEGRRYRCNIFPPLKDMRARWLKDTGEVIVDPAPAGKSGEKSDAASDAASFADDAPVEGIKITLGRDVGECPGDDGIDDAVQKAWENGETDLDRLAAVAEAAASTPKRNPLPTRLSARSAQLVRYRKGGVTRIPNSKAWSRWSSGPGSFLLENHWRWKPSRLRHCSLSHPRSGARAHRECKTGLDHWTKGLRSEPATLFEFLFNNEVLT